VKCPKCSVDLQPTMRHKIQVNCCPSCKGMWLEHDELEDFCPTQHGYWLNEDEDSKLLELMKREEAHPQRKLLAEDKWAATLEQTRSPTVFSKLRDLLHR
jgi:Zn-finger nucleic acid-binding protein